MKRILFPFLMALALLGFAGCNELDPADDIRGTKYYANMFAYNIMQVYYLWEADVADGFKDWTYGVDPKEKVRSMRYKENGKEVDKWTSLTDNFESYMGSVTGNTKSMGMEFKLFYADDARKTIKAVVTFTYAGSPAEKAGLKRGDTILTLDGKTITADNYSSLVPETLYGGGTVKLGLESGKTVSLTAVQMYEDPLQTVTTMTVGGKKIGYLHFSSFTMDACRDLEPVFRTFQDYGIEELVLDLRYNGGGYTITGQVLGSMLAPLEEVTAHSVFNVEVYNKTLTEAFKDELETCFAEEIEVQNSPGSNVTYTVHPAQVNPGIQKLWVITTGDTASASESLVCGLKPYMAVKTVGERSYGKFCGGYLISAKAFFDSLTGDRSVEGIDSEEGKEKTDNWGIYVMCSRYSDKNGVTLSMPDGIPADYEAHDNPFDGHQLGDPEETMLAYVLSLSTGTAVKAPLTTPDLKPAPAVHRPGFGMLINDNVLW